MVGFKANFVVHVRHNFVVRHKKSYGYYVRFRILLCRFYVTNEN